MGKLRLQEIQDETQRLVSFQSCHWTLCRLQRPHSFRLSFCHFTVQGLSEWHRHLGRSETRANPETEPGHSLIFSFIYYSSNKHLSSVDYAFLHFSQGELFRSMVSTTNMLKTFTSILLAQKEGFFPKKNLVSFLNFPFEQSTACWKIEKDVSCLNMSEQNWPFLLHVPNLFSCVVSQWTMPPLILPLVHSLYSSFHQGLLTLF